MLRTIPKTLSYIGDLADVLKEEDQTVEHVKSTIKMSDLKDKEECVNVNQKSNFFVMEGNSSMKKQV